MDVARDGGYIVDIYESTAKSKELLFQEGLRQLKKRAYPEVKYEVALSEIGLDVKIGQRAEITDSEFKTS